jgi:membrane-bound lytic murein transglycosylase MltF
MRRTGLALPLLTVLFCSIACSGSPPAASKEATPGAEATTAAASDGASPYDALPEGVRSLLDAPFTGDLDQMVERRLIRAGVVFNRTQYFIDRGTQRGIVYESLRLFEEELNRRMKTGKLPVKVAFVPLPRNALFTALAQGKVDLVAAALTVTPEREKLAAFSLPTRTGISELVVTGAGAPPVSTAADLSGRQVFVRRSSSYYESLLRLNEELKAQGRPAVVVKDAPEALEDDDLLEMVNAGLIEATVVDDFVAEFWGQVFPNIRVAAGAHVRTGGTTAVGVRAGNPKLLEAVNAWITAYGPRTAFGNIMDKRYLEDVAYVRSATSEAERRKFETVVRLFRKYGEQYDVDFLLMAAQGYQESGLDHSRRSRVGAVGIMQVMPATGQELSVGDIKQLEPNIHAGVKYFRFMMDQYYKDEPMDRLNKGLMTLASYNAGPARVRQLRQEAVKRGLDPNVWFGHVERVASERIGRETVQYVANIYKYYVAYLLVVEQMEQRRRVKTGAAGTR